MLRFLRKLFNYVVFLVKPTKAPEQWTDEERRWLERQGKPPLKINLIKPTNDEFTESPEYYTAFHNQWKKRGKVRSRVLRSIVRKEVKKKWKR